MGAAAAQALVSRGVQSLCIAGPSTGRARSMANRYGVQACTLEEGRTRLAAADLVIAASATPQTLLSADEIRQSLAQRAGRPLLIMDLGMPRNVDPSARSLHGVGLYDLDDLTRASRPAIGSTDAELEAERIVLAEAQKFGKALRAADAMPAIELLRRRLDEICRQELESFRLEQGPFPKEQDQLLAAVSARITHKIAGSLARELRGLGDAERATMKAGI